MIEPIKPDEVEQKLPDEVIQVFNELIAEKWNGEESYITLKEATVRVAKALDIEEDEVFAKKYMDVEPLYRKAGWVVKFDQPVSYAGENFRSYYLFSKKPNAQSD